MPSQESPAFLEKIIAAETPQSAVGAENARLLGQYLKTFPASADLLNNLTFEKRNGKDHAIVTYVTRMQGKDNMYLYDGAQDGKPRLADPNGFVSASRQIKEDLNMPDGSTAVVYEGPKAVVYQAHHDTKPKIAHVVSQHNHVVYDHLDKGAKGTEINVILSINLEDQGLKKMLEQRLRERGAGAEPVR